MYMGVLPACMSVYHVCTVPERPEKESDNLEQELQMIVSCCVEAGIEPWPSGRTVCALNP